MPESPRARPLTDSEAAQLRLHFGSRIPIWYAEFLGTLPMANRIIRYTGSKTTWDLWWAGADMMISEDSESLPGRAVASAGYVPVAIDPTGSGNPYFVRFDDDDPPIVQVFHDRIGPSGEILSEHSTVVCDRMSRLFRDAIQLA